MGSVAFQNLYTNGGSYWELGLFRPGFPQRFGRSYSKILNFPFLKKHPNNTLALAVLADRDFGSQYRGPGSLHGCMHDPWENTCTCHVNISCILGNNLS